MREDMQRICGTDNLYIDLCKMQNKKKICRPLSVAEHFLCLVSCDEYLGIFRSVFSQFFSRVFVLLGIFFITGLRNWSILWSVRGVLSRIIFLGCLIPLASRTRVTFLFRGQRISQYSGAGLRGHEKMFMLNEKRRWDPQSKQQPSTLSCLPSLLSRLSYLNSGTIFVL